MDKFYDGGDVDMLITLVIEMFCNQQNDDWAQALPAAVYNIMTKLVYQRDIRMQAVPD